MRYIIFLLTVSLFLSGCNKDKYLRLPVVETFSVEVSGTEVIVTGKVIDDGNTGGLILGFCYEKGEEPATIQKNQILVDWMYSDGTFQTAIQKLEQGSTYYFKAFIVNDQGYATGNAIRYVVPRFEAPAAPCEDALTTNRITDGEQSYPVTVSSGISPFSGSSYDFTVSCGSWNLEIVFSFREKPITGVYSTVGRIERYGADDQVSVQISKRVGFSNQTMVINTGLPVYVNRVDDDKITISFCDLIYRMNINYTYYDFALSGKFESEEE
jgi:hypothetical protein